MAKKILITGSTDGIGKLAAQRLINEGHHVYLHGRDAQKVNNTVAELGAGKQGQDIRGFVADLSDLKEVETLSKLINDELDGLDVLINNAGVFKSPNATNKDGIDLRMVVNYLAPYSLTQGLLPLLRKSAEARIINLSSAAQAEVDLEILRGNKEGIDQQTYAMSKLALTMWSFDLAQKEKNIAVVAVNPGSLLNTRMVKEGYGTFWSPAEKGGDILHDLAVEYSREEIDGKYFDNDKGGFGPAHTDAYDAGKIAGLLKVTEEMVQ